MEDIGIRELIGIVQKRKWFIAVLTVVCLLLSGIASFIVLKPVYQAEAVFKFTPFEINSGYMLYSNAIIGDDLNRGAVIRSNGNWMLGSVINQVRYPRYDGAVVADLLRSPDFMKKIMADQGIDKEDSPMKNISILFDPKAGIENGATVTIRIKDVDAQRAEKLLKAILEYFPQYIAQRFQAQMQQSLDLLEQGIKRETKDMESSDKKYREMLASIGGIENIDKVSPEKRVEYRQASNSFMLSTQALGAYQIVHKEASALKALNVSQMMDIHVVTGDKPSLKVLSPRKKLNMVLAGGIGLSLSLFWVIFIEYWTKPGTRRL